MDLCLYALQPRRRRGGGRAGASACTPAQVERVYKDIEAKRRTTRYLHLPPVLIEKVVEI